MLLMFVCLPSIEAYHRCLTENYSYCNYFNGKTLCDISPRNIWPCNNLRTAVLKGWYIFTNENFIVYFPLVESSHLGRFEQFSFMIVMYLIYSLGCVNYMTWDHLPRVPEGLGLNTLASLKEVLPLSSCT